MDNFDSYRNIDAVNWSTLKALRESALAYRYLKDHPRPATPAMTLGTAAHAAILEPERFEASIAVYDGEFRTNEAKAWKAAQVAAGKLVLTTEAADNARNMRDAVRGHKSAAYYLARGEAEKTLTWTDADTGLRCKGRVDWLHPGTIVDVKTTRTVEERAFKNSMEQLGVFHQLAMYRMGAMAMGLAVDPRLVILAVESAPPHDVGVFVVGTGDIESATAEVRNLLDTLKGHIDADEWPGRHPAEKSISRPVWATMGDLEMSFDQEAV